MKTSRTRIRNAQTKAAKFKQGRPPVSKYAAKTRGVLVADIATVNSPLGQCLADKYRKGGGA